jgi:hypothetical protein
VAAVSVCTTGRCPHDRGVFIWLADGPWLGDQADSNHGGYPWVHDTTEPGSGGHLVVCDLKPFATPVEAGEVCACGHHEHEADPGPLPAGMVAKPRHCRSCGCPDFQHRPEDIARWRAAGLLSANRYRHGETVPQPLDEHELLARLSEGEAVPGHPAACAREGCAHLTLWHGENGRFKGKPCGKCPCPGFTREAGQVMPLVQGSLFDEVLA